MQRARTAQGGADVAVRWSRCLVELHHKEAQAEHRSQDDGWCCAACIKAWLCGPCYSMQIVNEIMLKERLNYGCIFVEKDSGAPTFTPAATEMART